MSFHVDGGTVINSINFNYLEKPIKPVDPLKTGFVFDGWYVDKSFQKSYTFDKSPNENIILYAKYKPVEYTINYFLDGGTNDSNNPFSYNVEDDFINLNNPIKEGYSFIGWFYDEELSQEATNTINTSNFTTLSFYAKWAINTFSINFITEGNSIETLNIDYGEEIPPLEVSLRVGHSFKGWYNDINYNNIFNYQNMPAQDFELYALFEVNQYSIYYYLPEDNASYENAHLEIGETLDKVFAGVSNSIFLTSDNRVFSVGRNMGFGVLGHTATPYDMTDMFGLEEDEFIMDISSASFNMAALSNKGRVFTWGQNEYGQLGNGNFTESEVPIDVTEYFNLASEEKIVQISLGIFHGLVLTSDNRLFTWGRNNYSQLGDGTTNDSSLPINIGENIFLNEEEEILQIETGLYFNGLRTSDNRVYTWGWNGYGQLGNNGTFNVMTPQPIYIALDKSSGETIEKISFNALGSGLLTSKGRILVWGNNESGRLAEYTNGNVLTASDVTSRFSLETMKLS